MPADEIQPPDEHDDDTQARHVARRAELLPEERVVGSDDPQAQAILKEGEERTEHPERDVSLPASPQPSPETDVD